MSCESRRISAAFRRGTTTTPSASPTTISPGSTTIPPQFVGTLTSPSDPLPATRGEVPRANTGKPILRIPSMSRTQPSVTNPARPFSLASVEVISPKTATSGLPWLPTTRTSPGLAACRPCRMARKSPTRVDTVHAGPQIFVPDTRACIPESIVLRLPAASLIFAAGICRNFAMICGSGREISELIRNTGDFSRFPPPALCFSIFDASA